MGSSSSKSTIKQLNDIAVDVVNKNVQSCMGNAQQSQLIKIKGVKKDVNISGVNQSQGATINMKCVFSNDTQNKIQSQIAQEFSNMAKAKGGDWTQMGITASKANTDIKNIFKSSINNETLSKQVSSIIQNQELSVEDVDGSVTVANVDQTQTASLIAETMVANKQYADVIEKVGTAIDSGSSAEGGGIFTNFFKMLGGFSDVFLYGIIALVVLMVLGGIGYGVKTMMDKNKRAGGRGRSMGRARGAAPRAPMAARGPRMSMPPPPPPRL